MAQTHDGGIVLCGSDRKEGEPRSEPFVMKINACGEKEWCRKFSESPPDNLPFAYDVAVDLNGNIIVLVNEYGIHPIETMHLFKLSSDGDILWRAPYANPYNHPGSIQPLGDEIRILQNGKYLVTGDIYWKHP